MRLIDADVLINTLQELFDKREKEARFTGDRDVTVTWNDAIYHIKTAPAIEERKKGKWIPHKELSCEYIGSALVSIIYDYWYCDCCGYKVENGQPTYNYCPNCGARMKI